MTKPDDKEKDGMQFLLEITGPQKDDQAKYKCVVKNAEGQNQVLIQKVFSLILQKIRFQQSLNLVFD